MTWSRTFIRKITEMRKTGAGKCPLVAQIYSDRTLVSEVTGRQVDESLRREVER